MKFTIVKFKGRWVKYPTNYHPRLNGLQSSTKQTLTNTLMRIFLSAIVILLGANLLIDLLDSDMMEVINERNETIQRQIDQM